MLHFVTSYMKQNKSRKQTRESAKYGLEISFNTMLCWWWWWAFENKILKDTKNKGWQHTCVYWISAGEKSTSGWRTNRLYIVVIQNDSFRSQLVHVWSVNFRAMKSHITPSKIIDNHQQNVQRTANNLEYKCQQTQWQEQRNNFEPHISGVFVRSVRSMEDNSQKVTIFSCDHCQSTASPINTDNIRFPRSDWKICQHWAVQNKDMWHLY